MASVHHVRTEQRSVARHIDVIDFGNLRTLEDLTCLSLHEGKRSRQRTGWAASAPDLVHLKRAQPVCVTN